MLGKKTPPRPSSPREKGKSSSPTLSPKEKGPNSPGNNNNLKTKNISDENQKNRENSSTGLYGSMSKEKEISFQESPTDLKETGSPHLERLNLGPRRSRYSIGVNDRKRENLKKQITDLSISMEKECYKIIFDLFPEKIQRLDDLYKKQPEFNVKPEDIYEELVLPEYVGTRDEIFIKKILTKTPTCRAVIGIQNLVQEELLDLAEYLNSLGIWIRLNQPRISDGNNFGVEVQSQIASEINTAEDNCYAILESFQSYHLNRGSLIEKILDYPNVEDYRRALKELDEKQYIKSSIMPCDLRNDFIALYMLISQHLEVLMQPRGNEAEHMRTMY